MAPFLPAGVVTAGDPALTLYDSAGDARGSNDNWGGGESLADAFAQVGAFPLEAAGLDAALLEPVAEPITVHLGCTSNGVGLVELYDTRTTSNVARLVNFSARYQVGVGTDVLVAGFVIEGSGRKTLLIRGIGPGLAGHNVSGYLEDTVVSVFDSSGHRIAINDDWAGNLGEVFADLGAFALTASSKDAALVVSLAPGVYTVHLSGKGDATGEGLIEVYDMDL